MKLLLHANFGAHYRTTIYRLIGKEIGCDYCFGDIWDDIKKIDYSILPGKVIELKNIFFSHCYYQKGMIRMLRMDYDTFIVTGEARCISTWLFLILRKVFYRHKRVFFWGHGMLGKESRLKQWITRLFYSLVDGALIYNNRSCQILAAQGIPSATLQPIYNSLDYDTQLSIRHTLEPSFVYHDHFCNDNKNIVFIGRLTKIKKLELLLDALAELKKRDTIINVTFIGDGINRENMERRVDELGIRDQVWFYGACYDESINANLIYNADVCVSPGNIGLTAIHVMMFGCPAITNDDFNCQMPEFEAIHDGITGCFFRADDSHSLANSISEWFNLHTDDRDLVRQACYQEIDAKWNPHVQIITIKDFLRT